MSFKIKYFPLKFSGLFFLIKGADHENNHAAETIAISYVFRPKLCFSFLPLPLLFYYINFVYL